MHVSMRTRLRRPILFPYKESAEPLRKVADNHSLLSCRCLTYVICEPTLNREFEEEAERLGV